jgi:hypothetical protein
MPKLLLPRTLKPLSNLVFEDDEVEFYDEYLDFQVGYRRPELITEESDLSDYVKFRLWLARQLAIRKHKEIWG